MTNVSLTGAQVRSLYEAAFLLFQGSAKVSDAEIVADTVIDAALSALAPGVAFIAIPASEALAAYLIEGIASGRIKGSASPILDGQTKDTPHMGRRS